MKMEFRKKTAILLIAIFMISVFAVAIPVDATFGNEEDFWLAEWSQVDVHSGDWSIYFKGTGSPYDGGGSSIMIPVNLKLSEIASKSSSYWTKLITTVDPDYPGQDDYPFDPEIVLLIDGDGDGDYEHGWGLGDDYLFGQPVYIGTGAAGDDTPVSTHGWTNYDINYGGFLFWDHAAGPGYPPGALKSLEWYLANDDTGTVTDARWGLEDFPWRHQPENPVYDLTKIDNVDITGDMFVKYVVLQHEGGYEAYVDDLVLAGQTILSEPFAGELSNVLLQVEPEPLTLDITIDGQGTVGKSIAPPYGVGDTLTLTANPATNWHFKEWTGAITGSVNPSGITMDTDKSVTAHFELDVVSISVDPMSVDFGLVTMGTESAIETVTITNEGTVEVDISASVSTAFYEDYLRIDGTGILLWDTWTHSIVVAGTMPLDLTLDLTTCRESGIQEDTLVFWAEETP